MFDACKTVQKTSDIGSLFRWAEARGYIERNPFYNLQLPKSKKNADLRDL